MVVLLVLAALLAAPLAAGAQGNGSLQLHFVDVGQGDGALLVTPGGQTVMFDNGPVDACPRLVAYLDGIGVTKIDHHVASHYHADHIGCTDQVLAAFPLQGAAFDRGGTFTSTAYTRYLAAVGARRQTAPVGTSLALDGGVVLDFVAANGAGVAGASHENDLSLVVRIRYGQFEAVIGGDLGGLTYTGHQDIETTVAPLVGQVEVYKTHHHGADDATNQFWVDTVRPRVAIVPVGAAAGFPGLQAMTRLRQAGVRSYWTQAGAGTPPLSPHDVVSGHTVVEMAPQATSFAVRGAGFAHTYPLWGAPIGPPGPPRDLRWSVSGTSLSLTWLPPDSGGAPAEYQVEAAVTAGGAAVITQRVPGTSAVLADLAPGTYYVRVRALNTSGASAPSAEVAAVVPVPPCLSPPGTPAGLSSQVSGSLVTLAWTPAAAGCAATRFVVLAGSHSGAADYGAIDVGLQNPYAIHAPPGTYYVRVVAANGNGASAPSAETVVTVGGGCPAPPVAPYGLVSGVSGSTVTLAWSAPPAGCAPASYVVMVGTAPGASNLLVANVGSVQALTASAPPGVYYVRVAAANAYGTSAPSNEVTVTVR